MRKKFNKYLKLQDEIFDYFEYTGFDVGIDIDLDIVDYSYDEYSLTWYEESDEYSEEIIAVYTGKDYTMFHLNTCTGDEVLKILKNKEE
jgi:hypothetical protein